MIRRELSTDAGQQWALIPQIAHARLAGELASHWGAGPFAPLEPRAELVWSVANHDDGWREWDQNPPVDPARGCPRSFTEMELADSLAIWSVSIEQGEIRGPLEAYFVAGHFCALARRVSAWITDPERRGRADAFLDRYEAKRTGWLAAWRSQAIGHTRELAERGVAQLQMFDALSLWLCCSPSAESEELPTPGGPVLTLRPRDSRHIALSPWPFAVERLNLEVQARTLAARYYANEAELAAAPSQSLRLHWQLSSSGQKS